MDFSKLNKMSLSMLGFYTFAINPNGIISPSISKSLKEVFECYISLDHKVTEICQSLLTEVKEEVTFDLNCQNYKVYLKRFEIYSINFGYLGIIMPEKDFDVKKALSLIEIYKELARSKYEVLDLVKDNIAHYRNFTIMSLIQKGAFISATLDEIFRRTLDIVSEMRISQSGYIFHIEGKEKIPLFLHSFPDKNLSPALIESNDNIILKSIAAFTPIIKNRANLDASFLHPIAKLKADNYLVTPILLKKQCFGVIVLCKWGEKNDFTSIDEKTVFAIAGQSAVIIENHKLYFELKENFIKTIEALAAAIDMKDKFTIGHSKRVSRIAIAIAGELGIEEENEIFDIKIGALLHDIGKIGIPSELLYKSSSPTREEWEIIRKHPLNGEEIVKNLSGFEGIISAIKYHHERWDGLGYPHGLKGTQIPLITRIVSVADAYDTIISRRPYKEALSSTDAFNSIVSASSTQFDPDVVKAFERAYNKGSIIKIVKN